VEYLENDLQPYIDDHYEDGNCLLLHDNHPAHKSSFVWEWIESYIDPEQDFVLPHPPLSPDLSPVENVGGMLKWLLWAERPVITDPEDLWDGLKKVYETLAKDRQFFMNLLESMPTRMA
jgi:hypothetical protein